MAFPQPQSGILQAFANFVTQVATSGNASYTANAGDIVLVDTNATPHAFVVDLPPVAQAASVIVKCTAYDDALTIKTTDGSTIDGIAGATGVTLAAQYDAAWFVSDGAAWHVFSLGTVVS
jgi:hypothetical protein